MGRTDTDGEHGAASSEATPKPFLPSEDGGPAPGDGIGAGPAGREPLIASAPHAIAVTDGDAHVIRQVNPAFCRLMRVEPADVLDRPYGAVLGEPVGSDLLALLQRVLVSGMAAQDLEVAQPGAGDEPVVWSYAVWPFRDRAGSVAGLVVEVRDRTDEARATRMLRGMADDIRQINERLLGSALREQEWAEKAEAAARTRSDFLSMMSHELRTPLNGIMSYTEMLLGGHLGPTNERQRQGLQRISACSDHLLTMIEDVLSFAQVEAQGLRARSHRVDLGRLAREAAALIEPLAAKKGLNLRLEIPDPSLAVDTDAHKLRQILLNLLGNAVKFTEQGEVRLEVCEDPEDGQKVRVRVQDTGIGIPVQDLERIFEPFVQSEAVLTRRFGGTGLGLPISRALAALLGGALTAESTLGHGATFTLRLPHSVSLQPAMQ